MKQCPFCAEEIQETAMFCRYCGRKVKTSPYRIIIPAVIITSLLIFTATHRTQISRAYYNAKMSIEEFCTGCQEFFNSVRRLPDDMKAFTGSNDRISSMMDSISKGTSQGAANSSE